MMPHGKGLRRRILEALQDNPGVSADQLVEMTAVSRRALAGGLIKLKREGLVAGVVAGVPGGGIARPVRWFVASKRQLPLFGEQS